MYCKQCGFHSFDYLADCPKCGQTWEATRKALGLEWMEAPQGRWLEDAADDDIHVPGLEEMLMAHTIGDHEEPETGYSPQADQVPLAVSLEESDLSHITDTTPEPASHASQYNNVEELVIPELDDMVRATEPLKASDSEAANKVSCAGETPCMCSAGDPVASSTPQGLDTPQPEDREEIIEISFDAANQQTTVISHVREANSQPAALREIQPEELDIQLEEEPVSSETNKPE